MHPIVIATGNPHKVDELRAIFAEQGIAVIGLRDLPGYEHLHEPEEPGATFEANATIKALSYAAQTGRVCLADDSGLEVDALHGAPGVISSHFSTNGVETGLTRPERDAANNQTLLARLEGVPEAMRAARFVCVMALATPQGAPTGGIGLWPVRPPDSGTLVGSGVSPRAPSSPAPPVRPLDLAALKQVMSPDLQKSERTLPHWEAGGSTYFITFRVKHGTLSPTERDSVVQACLFWHGKKTRVFILVVMPDHVHILMKPLPDGLGGWHRLPIIMHSIKSFTSHRILKLRGQPGPLWQSESYDRIVRSNHEFDEKWEYITLNPVRAGLVSDAREYPFLVQPNWTPEDRSRTESEYLRGLPFNTHRPEAYATGVLAIARGTFEGRIGLPGDVPRGNNGFGYDPLFLLPAPSTQSSAELPPEEKNRLSHRGAAARLMAAQIRQLSLGHRAAQTAPPGTPPGPASR